MIPAKKRLKIGEFYGPGAPRPEKVIKNPSFSLRIFKTLSKHSRFGVAVGIALDKRASERIRVKRAIFIFFRLNIDKFPVADYIISPSKNMTSMTNDEIIKLLNKFLISN